jgi:hypothetical protein
MRCRFRTWVIIVSVMLIGWSAATIRTRTCIAPRRRSNPDDVIRSGDTEFRISRSVVLKSKSSPSEIFATKLYPPVTRSTDIVWNMRWCLRVHKHAITLRTKTRSSGSTLVSTSIGISFISSESKTDLPAIRVEINRNEYTQTILNNPPHHMQ